jgi:hypothetical protein
MSATNGQNSRTRTSQRREWTRTAAVIGIACLLFNALIGSGHSVRMAANAAGLGDQTILCTPFGAVSVPTASLTTDGDNSHPTANAGWECPVCAFGKLAGASVSPEPHEVGPAGIATRAELDIPETHDPGPGEAASSAHPRAPPLPV